MEYHSIPMETGGVLFGSLKGASIESIVGNPHAVVLVLANGHKAHAQGSLEFWREKIEAVNGPIVLGQQPVLQTRPKRR